MISPKKIIEAARTWHNGAFLKRRRICLSRNNVGSCDQKSKIQVAQKGHFVVYSIDKKRFVIPLCYLSHNIFKELFKMSEEEFGLPGAGPITLPCDAVFMEYVISLVKQHALEESRKASFASMVASRCSFNPADQRSQRIPLPSF